VSLHDLLCKAWPDRGLACSAQGRICNNMLYVRYVHLTRPIIFIRDKPVLSSERMLRKGYYRKSSVAKMSVVASLKGLSKPVIAK
jgi:hypothetical protein